MRKAQREQFRSATPQRADLKRQAATSLVGRFFCKSRKSNNHKNLAKADLKTCPQLRRLSAPLRRSEIDFGPIDMVPHIAARKTHQRLYEFLFDTPKRLLQQNRPIDDIGRLTTTPRLVR